MDHWYESGAVRDQVLELFAQNTDRFFDQYNFKFITESKGLPYSFVSDIFKDSDGYIWVATHHGIGRYDGYEFLNYDLQTVQIKWRKLQKLLPE